MSMRDVARFFGKVTEDHGLRNRVQDALDRRGDKAQFEIVDIAAAQNCAFTATELREYLVAHADPELSESELEAVTGGALDIRSLNLTGLETIRLAGPQTATKRQTSEPPNS